MPWPTIWGGEPKEMSSFEQSMARAHKISSSIIDAFNDYLSLRDNLPNVILLHPDDIELLTSSVNWPTPIKAKKFMNIPVRQSTDVEQGNCEVF